MSRYPAVIRLLLEPIMKLVLSLLAAAGVAATVSLPAAAQQDAGQCILAGRITEAAWAPRFESVQLLDASGQGLAAADRNALGGVRQARLGEPALLSRCNGDGPLPRADDEPPRAKSEVPALSAGLVEVESVGFPQLRTGGVLVELKVRVPAERVVMLTR
jgi:hypothetical protein